MIEGKSNHEVMPRMEAEDFARRWNEGLRRHLEKIAAYYGPSYAEEAVGDCLLFLLKSLHRLPEQGEGGFNLGRYARMILKQKMILRWHKAQRGPKFVPMESIVDGKTVIPEELQQRAIEAHRNDVERREASETAQSLLEQIPDPTDRFILRELADGLTNQEIGDRLGVSRQRVHQRLQRLKKREYSV